MKIDIMKNIALTIVRAQACSDAGKHIYYLDLNDETSNRLIGREYEAKDEQILKAINIICRLSSERAGVKFDVIVDPEKIAYYIVYFTYYIDSQKRQISFHSFSSKVGKFCKNSKVRWDMQDCRKNCRELITSNFEIGRKPYFYALKLLFYVKYGLYI